MADGSVGCDQTRLHLSVSDHTIPYHTIPYHTIPYHTIPYHTIPDKIRSDQTRPDKTPPLGIKRTMRVTAYLYPAHLCMKRTVRSM